MSSDAAIAASATCTEALVATPRHGPWFSSFWTAPFRDVDDRVALLAAGRKAEKAARDAAMPAAPHYL